MSTDKNTDIKWEIHSEDGKVTEGNEWAKELTEHIGKVCLEHGKGFIFAPWGGSNLTCKSFFATNHTDPDMFGAGIAMMLSNYLQSSAKRFKSEEDMVKWAAAILKTAFDFADVDLGTVLKGMKNDD